LFANIFRHIFSEVFADAGVFAGFFVSCFASDFLLPFNSIGRPLLGSFLQRWGLPDRTFVVPLVLKLLGLLCLHRFEFFRTRLD